jgi:ADP-heptose:LPS heptosyltransferase
LTLKESNPAVKCKPWRSADPPKKILAIRFQAIGDVVITLPYLLSLKKSLPGVKIHMLTRDEAAEIPQSIDLFEKVIRVGGGRNAKLQFALALLLLPYLLWQRYDVVLDLQNHRISRIVRFMLFPRCWSEFDKTSKISAGERTRQAIQAAGFGKIEIEKIGLQHEERRLSQLLIQNGWDGKHPLVILNPAGAFITRNWPLDNYHSFARLWMEKVEPQTFFVFIGFEVMARKAALFRSQFGERCIDLSGKTTGSEAFSIVGRARLVLTEDSGLMHMAWVQGVPTVALFGSTPSYWSAPLGEWSRCLSSSDLPCGDCFSATCQFGDVPCLTRYSPQHVLEEAMALESRMNDLNH